MSDRHGAKHSPLTSGSGAPSGSFWIEVSNLGISDTQMRNLETLHIQIAAGKYKFSVDSQTLISESMNSHELQNAWKQILKV